MMPIPSPLSAPARAFAGPLACLLAPPSSPLWGLLWLAHLLAVCLLVAQALRAVVRTLPEEGTAVASMRVLRSVVVGLMLLHLMAFSLPRLAGVHNVMAGVGAEQTIHGHAIDSAFILDSPVSDVVGALSGMGESVYAIMLAMGIQADTGGPIELTRDFVGAVGMPFPDLLTYLYSFVLVALCAVAPVALAAVAVTQIWNILRRWQHVVMRIGHKDVFLFSGLDEANVALAKSTFEQFADDRAGRPLVIFCDVGSSDRDERGDLIDTLTDLGRGSALFTHRAMTDVLPDLERSVRLLFWRFEHTFEQIRCFLLSDDCAANVNDAIDVIDLITDAAAKRDPRSGVSPLDALVFNKDGDALVDPDDPGQKALFEQLRAAKDDARRFHVYCLHDNQENELVFDSLAYGSTGGEGGEALSVAVRQVRLSTGVRLVSRAREQAYDVLTRHPLYDVLDRPRYDADDFAAQLMGDTHVQELYVFVVGLGSYGIEALKTAYWIGRMRNVRLHIVGIDRNGDEIREMLEVTYPEMMREEHGVGERVVRIEQASAFTAAFTSVLRRLPPEARVYSVITLGDDQLNLNVALAMRRTFDDMLRKGLMAQPVDSDRNRSEFPIILPLINSSELYEAADRMTSDKAEAFRLEPFGKTEEVFSYRNIVTGTWEEYALSMNAAYREVWEWRKGRMRGSIGVDATFDRRDIEEEYAEYEIKKLSNRTNVRHIPYRLWCLGIDPACYIGAHGEPLATIDTDLWHKIMGYDDACAKELMSHHRGEVRVGEERRFDAAKMREEQDDLRRRYPVVCAFAELEHERWLAFYRSEGWRDLTIEECDRLVDLGLIEERKVHQSPKLRLHCYLCSNEDLLERGIALGDDPYTYDRAAVMETPRILARSLFWN